MVETQNFGTMSWKSDILLTATREKSHLKSDMLEVKTVLLPGENEQSRNL